MLDLYLVPESDLTLETEDNAFTDAPNDRCHRLSITLLEYRAIAGMLDVCATNYSKFNGRGFSFIDDVWITSAEAKNILDTLLASNKHEPEIAETSHFTALLRESARKDLCIIGVAD